MENEWFLFDEDEARAALAREISSSRPSDMADRLLDGDVREALAKIVADRCGSDIAEYFGDKAEAEHDMLAVKRVLTRAAAKWNFEVKPTILAEDGTPDWPRIKAVEQYQKLLLGEMNADV